ncbi:MAG TPA: hypothetical protein VLU46_14160 [Thermoanaerobaculia bacterium]|nr:hypothetical protein [Thermoanaerobaculia bacterium]
MVLGTLFIAARVVLLYAREPFFDELFTLWMARQPLSRVIPNLLHDSGPPLFYFLARFDSVIALRWLSLAFAAVQFALVAKRSTWSAALLALYPPAVLFAVDARAYALCALFVTAGVIALEAEKPLVAACFFALAAHAHYYGVLFFPVLLVRKKVLPFLLAVILFGPGFILAWKQPAEALKWNREALFAPLANLSFAGMYPYALFAAGPVLLVAIGLVALAVAGSRSMRYADAVLVPLVLVLAFHVAGRPVYFPMRFEAVIAGPLVLWLGSSLFEWPVVMRRALGAALLAIAVASVAIGIADHERRPLDPYREAAIQLNAVNAPIVATGYLYLESVVTADRPITAWPADQALHPGWRSRAKADPRALPPSSFVWIGERFAPELQLLREARSVRPLFSNGRTLIARVAALTPPVH